MKRILKNKRGAALEGALLFMMTVFMLAMLLTGVVMASHLRTRLNHTIIVNEMSLTQIGEIFVNGEDYSEYVNGCIVESGTNNENETLTLTKGGKSLYIEKNGTKVIKWIYSAN